MNQTLVIRCSLALALMITCHRVLGRRATHTDVLTCDSATPARIGQPGVTYAGSVSNSDYRFTAKIPSGLLGLGSAPGAPFHGFAVFIDQTACIVFLIEHRVILSDDTAAPGTREKRVTVWVGNLRGLQKSAIGRVRGHRYLNTNVWVELPRTDYTNDVSITFVTPLDRRRTTEPIFRSFLGSFKFW